MKILAVEKENSGLGAEDFAPFLLAEARAVWELVKNKTIREIYFTDNHEAVLILECENIGDAQSILNELPLKKNGLITFELQSLNPYTGFERLFGSTDN